MLLFFLMFRRQQYVGGINEIHYDPYGQTGKRITVSTEKNVLASISVKTGEIGKCTMGFILF